MRTTEWAAYRWLYRSKRKRKVGRRRGRREMSVPRKQRVEIPDASPTDLPRGLRFPLGSPGPVRGMQDRPARGIQMMKNERSGRWQRARRARSSAAASAMCGHYSHATMGGVRAKGIPKKASCAVKAVLRMFKPSLRLPGLFDAYHRLCDFAAASSRFTCLTSQIISVDYTFLAINSTDRVLLSGILPAGHSVALRPPRTHRRASNPFHRRCERAIPN